MVPGRDRESNRCDHILVPSRCQFVPGTIDPGTEFHWSRENLVPIGTGQDRDIRDRIFLNRPREERENDSSWQWIDVISSIADFWHEGKTVAAFFPHYYRNDF